MAVADQQFTQAEQNWVDVYFGQGTSERFIQQLATIDWPQILERARQLGATLPADERNFFDSGIREWLIQMLSIEGLNDEELQRLNEFLAYLEVPSATDVVQKTLPPIIEGNPEPLPQIVTVDSETEHSFVDANIGQNPQTPEPEIPEPEPPPPPPRVHDIHETNEPPPMPQSQKRELPTKEIHISRDDEKYGPYSLDKLNKYLADGVIESSDMAWHKGLSDWVAVQEIEGVILPRNQSAPPIQAQKTDEPPPRHVPNDPPLRREHHLPQTQ